MDKHRMDALHKTALDYGQWRTGGCDRAGVGAVWPEMTRGEPHKPIRRRRIPDLERIGVCATQPHSDRHKPSSKLLDGKINTQYAKIHGIAVRQSIHIKYIIVFMYFKAMPFRDISIITGLSSRDISSCKYRFLDAINGIVR
jgi:hypothetical protein